MIRKVSNLTNTEIDELNKLGIKLKFFGKNELIIPIFEDNKIAFTSGILDEKLYSKFRKFKLK